MVDDNEVRERAWLWPRGACALGDSASACCCGGGGDVALHGTARGELRELIQRLDLIVQGAAHAFGTFVRRDRQALHLGAQARLLGGDVGGGARRLLAHLLGRGGETVA